MIKRFCAVASPAANCAIRVLRVQLISLLPPGPILQPDNPIPPRVALGFVMAQRLPVVSGHAVEVPTDFPVAGGQLAFQLWAPLHARAIHIDEPMGALCEP